MPKVIIRQTVAPDATVENSDATYTDTVASGGTLVLPDSDVNVNGSLEGSVVSVKDVDINVTDGVNPVTPNAVSVVGNTVTIEVPAGGGCTGTAGMFSTGQSTSYGDGDDSNINQDYWTLPIGKTNVWGHNFRWCGITGGYTDGVGYFDVDGVATTRVLAFPETLVCDLGHVDCDGNFPMYQYNYDLTANQTWDNARLSCIGFSTVSFPTGWRMITYFEAVTLYHRNDDHYLQHQPFEVPSAVASIWTGTSNKAGTSAFVYATSFQSNYLAKTSTRRAFPARTTNISEL
jgi:hypothetical protein